ncbi:sugar phosphate isomerase/epimerase [soil metagenome]
MSPERAPSRFSLNQYTTHGWSLTEAVAGCVERGVHHIGLWRDKFAELGLSDSAELLRSSGLSVSSLCRGGFFPTEADGGADNRRAVDEAAALGTDVLVLVCGGLPPNDRDLDRARQRVADGIAELATYGAANGVKLAIERLHPLFGADRSVIVSLAQALDIAEQFPADQVGVVVDTYHVWWDPDVWNQIERAGERILAFQVCDWIVPLPDVLLGRGMMGEGIIELRRFRQAVDAAGYAGVIEVEIFNQEIWNAPGDETLDRAIATYQKHVE